jgi:LytS/YehU family sensor histidine kinase
LVENAIRHGIGVRKQPDVISVRALVNQHRLNIEIENRASSLDDAPEHLLSRGVGLANTIARLERLYGSQQSFAIRNLLPRGVAVSLSLPARLLSLPLEEPEAQAVG